VEANWYCAQVTVNKSAESFYLDVLFNKKSALLSAFLSI